MKVSIIIPVLKINDYIRESIPKISMLDYEDYEIIVLPNVVTAEDAAEFACFPKVKLIASHESGPAFKRDLGAKNSTGEILVFLDDDAYPRKDWLKKIVEHFKSNENIGAVGGPAVTPDSDSMRQKASGAIFTSKLGGGNLTYRYWPGKEALEVDDFPSVNLSVRKDVFNKIGGFNSKYWPGEDTKLCHDILTNGYKIIYDPEILVWHHRRSSLIKHLKQIWQYALHRGNFVKIYPKNSLHLNYFIPSLFVLFLATGLILSLLIGKVVTTIYFLAIGLYLFALFITGIIEAFRIKNLFVGILVMPAIFLTHVFYGLGFILGLIKKDLAQ